MSLEVGIKGTCTVTADESNSAKTMRSGTLDVFATPAMIALMEKTAWTSVAPYLEPGEGTVGIHLDISHDAPTPLGMTITCESELVEIDGRKLVFSVSAETVKQSLGQEMVLRAIAETEGVEISDEKFQEKANRALLG